jgi:hypothetical protein
MPDELNPGQITTIAQSTSYALPPVVVSICSTAAVEVAVVDTTGTTGWSVLTGANTVGAQTSAAFVRCSGSATVIVVKRLS